MLKNYTVYRVDEDRKLEFFFKLEQKRNHPVIEASIELALKGYRGSILIYKTVDFCGEVVTQEYFVDSERDIYEYLHVSGRKRLNKKTEPTVLDFLKVSFRVAHLTGIRKFSQYIDSSKVN